MRGAQQSFIFSPSSKGHGQCVGVARQTWVRREKAGPPSQEGGGAGPQRGGKSPGWPLPRPSPQLDSLAVRGGGKDPNGGGEGLCLWVKAEIFSLYFRILRHGTASSRPVLWAWCCQYPQITGIFLRKPEKNITKKGLHHRTQNGKKKE